MPRSGTSQAHNRRSRLIDMEIKPSSGPIVTTRQPEQEAYCPLTSMHVKRMDEGGGTSDGGAGGFSSSCSCYQCPPMMCGALTSNNTNTMEKLEMVVAPIMSSVMREGCKSECSTATTTNTSVTSMTTTSSEDNDEEEEEEEEEDDEGILSLYRPPMAAGPGASADICDEEDLFMWSGSHVVGHLADSRWTEAGARRRHGCLSNPESRMLLDDDDDSTTWHLVSSDEEDEDEDDLLLPFLDPTTLDEALDVTNDCVVVTEPTHPYAITHANAAFTRLSLYHLHEISRLPMSFLQGPGTDVRAYNRMATEVDATGFGRCSVVNYTKDARPFLDHMSVVPVLNHTYSIPRLTHLCWTHDAVFKEKSRALERGMGRKRPREAFLGDGRGEEGKEEDDMDEGGSEGGPSRILLILPGSKRRAGLLEARASMEDLAEATNMTPPAPQAVSTTITPTTGPTSWGCWQPRKEERIECYSGAPPPPRLQVWVHSSPPTPVHTAAASSSASSTPPTPTMARLIPG